MQKKQKELKLKVLFNASVVLAGLNSPHGGSAKVLGYVERGKIDGYISEIIFDEIIRHSNKIGFKKSEVAKKCTSIFFDILESPGKKTVDKYYKIVIDIGDCHVLASAEEVDADYLVSLDKRHILVLKNRIRKFQIVSPAELIEIFNK